MFEKQFGNLTVKTEVMPKRGNCLKASVGDKYILMDYCGANPMLVPDGTNAYFFANKIILVTRWSDMSDAEKQTVQTGKLCLAFHTYQYTQFSLKVEDNWGDVMINLYHCISGWNNESAPVDEIIFIFADTHDSDYVISRSVMLPQNFQEYLMKMNAVTRKALAIEREVPGLYAQAEQDPSRDFYDYLYDICFEKTKAYSRAARSADPDAIPDGIYIEIDGNNRIVNVYQNADDIKKEPEVSGEVKLYMELASKGFAEGQYNLGYCYEYGDGIAQDHKQAVYWYKKAAGQGYAKAQYNLALCFYNGSGTDMNREEAAKLFRLAAEQGDMYAQYSMGVCYYNGDGVEKDIIKAVECFQNAAAQGHPEAKKVLNIQ